MGMNMNFLKQAQELQARMRQVQEELKHRTVEVTVGGGMVRATVNGQLELVQLEIDRLENKIRSPSENHTGLLPSTQNVPVVGSIPSVGTR